MPVSVREPSRWRADPPAGPSPLAQLVTGVLASAQALVLSLAVVVLPAVVAYLVGTAAQAAPADGAADAVQVRSAVEIASREWFAEEL